MPSASLSSFSCTILLSTNALCLEQYFVSSITRNEIEVVSAFVVQMTKLLPWFFEIVSDIGSNFDNNRQASILNSG